MAEECFFPKNWRECKKKRQCYDYIVIYFIREYFIREIYLAHRVYDAYGGEGGPLIPLSIFNKCIFLYINQKKKKMEIIQMYNAIFTKTTIV